MRNVELESKIPSLFILLTFSIANTKIIKSTFSKRGKNPQKLLEALKEVYEQSTINPVIMA